MSALRSRSSTPPPGNTTTPPTNSIARCRRIKKTSTPGPVSRDQHHRRRGPGGQRTERVAHARLLCAARLRTRRAK